MTICVVAAWFVLIVSCRVIHTGADQRHHARPDGGGEQQ